MSRVAASHNEYDQRIRVAHEFILLPLVKKNASRETFLLAIRVNPAASCSHR